MISSFWYSGDGLVLLTVPVTACDIGTTREHIQGFDMNVIITSLVQFDLHGDLLCIPVPTKIVANLHQVLGMGIASELDLAYWHVRYSAASKFQASDVTSSASFVVPPPEVYFVCLACHLPPTKDLRAFLRRANPAQRRMMENTFDLRLDAWDCEGAQ